MKPASSRSMPIVLYIGFGADWWANTARPPLPPRVRLPTAIVFECTAMPS